MSARYAHGRSARDSAGCKSTTSSTGIYSSSRLTAAFASFGLWWGAWAASLPAVRRDVGATNAQLGLILLAVALAALPAMIVTGRLSDRVGPRLVPVTLLAFAVAAALPPHARSPWSLFGFLLAVGAASGALDVAINARASSLETARRVRVMDGLHAAYSAGVVVGGISAGVLRRAGVSPSAILLGVAVVLLLGAAANVRAEPPLPGASARRAALSRPLLIVGAIFAVAALVESGVETWSALFVENGLHASPAISGLGPGLFAAAMVGGRLLAQRAAPASAAKRLAIAGVAAAAGLGISATASSPAVALAGVVVAGGGLALSVPTLFRAAGRIGAGPAISTVAVVGYLGFMAGPPLIGAVAGATSLRGGFLFLCAAAVLLAACAPVLRRLTPESQG